MVSPKVPYCGIRFNLKSTGESTYEILFASAILCSVFSLTFAATFQPVKAVVHLKIANAKKGLACIPRLPAAVFPQALDQPSPNFEPEVMFW